MNLLEEIKQRADANADGKLTLDDINALREKFPDQANVLDKVKALADANGDGKVDPGDLKNFNLGDVMGKVGSLFGK